MASRLRNRVQLTTDAFNRYPNAVATAFGGAVDYATVKKDYFNVGPRPGRRPRPLQPFPLHRHGRQPAKVSVTCRAVGGAPSPRHDVNQAIDPLQHARVGFDYHTGRGRTPRPGIPSALSHSGQLALSEQGAHTPEKWTGAPVRPIGLPAAPRFGRPWVRGGLATDTCRWIWDQ